METTHLRLLYEGQTLHLLLAQSHFVINFFNDFVKLTLILERIVTADWILPKHCKCNRPWTVASMWSAVASNLSNQYPFFRKIFQKIVMGMPVGFYLKEIVKFYGVWLKLTDITSFFTDKRAIDLITVPREKICGRLCVVKYSTSKIYLFDFYCFYLIFTIFTNE